jgi:glycosyltransferase involved in cell wall biosynthesis
MQPYVRSLGVPAARIRRVRNWSRMSDATMKHDDARLLLGWPEDAIVCLHAGNMGAKQGLENVIRAARLAASREERLLFVLMGDGNQRQALKAMADRAALPNLRFMTLQPELLYASVLHAADVLLVNQRGSVRDMALPSKLTSYFASGRPVVAAAAAESSTAVEVRESGGGIVVAPDDPAALLDAVRRVAGDAALAEELGRRGEHWSREVLSEGAALRLYERLVNAVLAAGHSEFAGPAVLHGVIGGSRNAAGAGRSASDVRDISTAASGRPTFDNDSQEQRAA